MIYRTWLEGARTSVTSQSCRDVSGWSRVDVTSVARAKTNQTRAMGGEWEDGVESPEELDKKSSKIHQRYRYIKQQRLRMFWRKSTCKMTSREWRARKMSVKIPQSPRGDSVFPSAAFWAAFCGLPRKIVLIWRDFCRNNFQVHHTQKIKSVFITSWNFGAVYKMHTAISHGLTRCTDIHVCTCHLCVFFTDGVLKMLNHAVT